MNFYDRTPGLVVTEVKWSDLTAEEQAYFIRHRYRPNFGSIIHGNADLEIRDADRNH